MALVDGFLELERSSGKLEWSAILQKMASDLGFSKILFGLLPKDSQDYENAFIVGNYPAAWREHYDRAGYARVDPTVSHCTQSVLPIFWEPSIYQTRKQHEFFEEASAAGLVYGLTMPLHGARGDLSARAGAFSVGEGAPGVDAESAVKRVRPAPDSLSGIAGPGRRAAEQASHGATQAHFPQYFEFTVGFHLFRDQR